MVMNMNKYLKILILLTLLINICYSQTDDIGEKAAKLKLSKPATSEDDAFGILDKGELINTVGNQGYDFRFILSKLDLQFQMAKK